MTARVIPLRSSMSLGCERTRALWDGRLLCGLPSASQQAVRKCLRILNSVQGLDDLHRMPALGVRRIGRAAIPRYEIRVDRWYRLRFEWQKGAAHRVVLEASAC